MSLPIELKQAIEKQLDAIHPKLLKNARTSLSANYHSGGDSGRGFRDPMQLYSYLATRMPATFGACLKVFQEIRSRLPQLSCKTLLDLGAGPGSASWAALEAFPDLLNIHLVEREKTAIEVGMKLNQNFTSRNWHWQQASLDSLTELPPADLAVLSYSFGELSENADAHLLERLLTAKIPVTVIIEPGTPRGYAQILRARQWAIQAGYRLIAPCPHAAKCPIQPGDWCHFSARIERTRLHRQLKDGSLGYEDEKFSYIAFTHPEFEPHLSPVQARVIRHPSKGSGHVQLTLCNSEGNIENKTITRSHREQYRIARDAEWGTALM